jgi:hypothetical protein
MPIATVIQLIATYGIPVVQQIVTWYESGKTTVSSADLATLATLSQYRSADALAAAGLKIVDGKAVPATP